jgi:Co/Zn/Cd efflux system component
VAERRVLRQLLAINAVMFVAELGFGIYAQSTGLLADSLDMLADAMVYGLSLYAVGRAVTQQKRAAHVSGGLQVALALGALAEVARRAVVGSEPVEVLMIGVAAIALVANLTCVALLARHRHGGVHLKASWIFSTNDALANLGVIVAGVLVLVTGSALPDLAVGAGVGVLVMMGGLRILRL